MTRGDDGERARARACGRGRKSYIYFERLVASTEPMDRTNATSEDRDVYVNLIFEKVYSSFFAARANYLPMDRN